MVGSTGKLVYNSELSLLPPFPANTNFQDIAGGGTAYLHLTDMLQILPAWNERKKVRSKEIIDFSNYSKIQIKYSISVSNAGGWGEIWFVDASTSASTSITSFGNTDGKINDSTCDISTINGHGYLYLNGVAYNYSSIDFNIYEIIFEA